MRGMPELDFIDYIESKPRTPAEDAEICEFIRRSRLESKKAKAARIKLEAKALVLLNHEQVELAYRLLSNLADNGTTIYQQRWAAAAKENCEEECLVRPIVKQKTRPPARQKKTARRTKSAKT